MPEHTPDFFFNLYTGFSAPISKLDCGKNCAPYNENHIPFCCDTRHSLPVAYEDEWEYLKAHTDLWHLWNPRQPEHRRHMEKQVPPGQVLIECLGYTLCQRNFRSITCRAFPFYPYFSGEGEFIGVSYYWEYEDRCWVISNLRVMTPGYLREMIQTMETLFERYPSEKEQFQYHSAEMRRVFGRMGRTILFIGRDGNNYKHSPRTGRIRLVPLDKLPKFGAYKIAEALPFPDEVIWHNEPE